MSGVGEGPGHARMRANETFRLVDYGQAAASIGQTAQAARIQTECH